ncbi:MULTISPECIES: hypothetical protein [Sphingomonas]|uniref:hypothetical protein n=1 Tax=Sphingomonas TaxID=13687 RepID=UPI00254A2A94|nr:MULTISPECIES: hypothetical protein [Sphingomonas]MDK8187675.1 hypothetical protein [Sphingomonas zeae]MDK8217363.1 hypothetical protein [Sphingomonas sp. UMB7805-LC452B]
MRTVPVEAVEIGLSGQRVDDQPVALGDDAVQLDAEIMPFGQVEVGLGLVRPEIGPCALSGHGFTVAV